MGEGVGITAYGAYLPVLRLSRAAVAQAHAWAMPGLNAKGHRTMAAWDEDAVTMAVEAAREALTMAETPPAALTLASTTLPFADRLNAGIVATALDLTPAVATQDAGGSQRAATSALIAALGSEVEALLVASEKRPTEPGSALELASGDAGAAVAVGRGRVLAHALGWASETADFVDHYRDAEGGADYVLEERWVRDAGVLDLVPRTVTKVLTAAGVSAAEIDVTLLAFPTTALAKAAVKPLGVPPQSVRDAFSVEVGLTGAAHPLLMLCEALETATAGQTLLLVAFGSGCDALVFRTTEALADVRPSRPLAAQIASGREETRYLRFLSFTGGVSYAWGIRAERDNRTAQTAAWRKSRDVYALVGGRCEHCGTVQFPRSRTCVNPNCREMDTQAPHPLSHSLGRLKTFTDDWQAFTPDPPLRYGNVGFTEGGNALMEIADCPPEGLRIGQPVRFAFRVKDYDARRGFRRYFWKAVPTLEQEAA